MWRDRHSRPTLETSPDMRRNEMEMRNELPAHTTNVQRGNSTLRVEETCPKRRSDGRHGSSNAGRRR